MTCPLSEPLALGGTCDLCWTAPACDLRAATDAEHDRTRAARDARILEAAMAKREDDPWAGYESGPFCQHWGDPADCDRECQCGHECCQHGYSAGCSVCGCEEFREKDGER